MIEKIRITGYRKFNQVEVRPHPRRNILVGENESGKSTLLEAIGLALTGRINGRPASEELNPYWFNQSIVAEFFAQRAKGNPALPTISIEIFLADRDEFQRNLHGAHNSEVPTRACAGVCFKVEPDPDYAGEIDAHLGSDTTILPVEYYRVDWRSFGDRQLTAKPKELTTAVIDLRTIRSTSSIDYHLRQMLSDHLESSEKAAISLAFRAVKERMTNEHLQGVNEKMAKLEGSLNNQELSLAMDQTARTSWDASVSPHVAALPFGMAGQGQQAAVKIALALGQRASAANAVTIEEPENHLSHTSLNKLLSKIDELAGDHQQLFITTHSSFVLNRLGLNSLLFVTNGQAVLTSAVGDETVCYFQKLPGYDTLRMVLADKIVLVEGPSDEIVFERFYKDLNHGRRPIEDGIDVISMRGLSLRRCLELAKALGKRCAALRDNDGHDPTQLKADLGELIMEGEREVFIGEPDLGHTLEPQIITANPDATHMRKVLNITERADPVTSMTNAKTEAALRILKTGLTVAPPVYFTEAIEFINGGDHQSSDAGGSGVA